MTVCDCVYGICSIDFSIQRLDKSAKKSRHTFSVVPHGKVLTGMANQGFFYTYSFVCLLIFSLFQPLPFMFPCLSVWLITCLSIGRV